MSPTTLSSHVWHPSAPRRVRQLCHPGEAGLSWKSWRAHVADRQRPLDLLKLLPVRCSVWPVHWGLAADSAQGSSSEPSLTEPSPAEWSAASAARRSAWAVHSLQQAAALPRLADQLPAAAWWSLLERLIRLGQEVEPIREQAAASLLAGGELPLLLSYLFPELTACRQLGEQARQRVQAAHDAWLDGEGLPHADLIAELRMLLASLTRMIALGQHEKRIRLPQQVAASHAWMLHHAIQWSRANGSGAFLSPELPPADRELISGALALAGDDEDWAAAQSALPASWSLRRRPTADSRWPANHSEWAGLAALRTDWTQRAPRVFVRYASRRLDLEIEATRGTVITGPWEVQITCNRERCTPLDSWEELCWISDDDVDFLELEQRLSQGIRLQRQVLLARATGVAWLCDYVLAERDAALSYQARWRLPSGVQFAQEADTNDGLLTAGSPLAALLPLALAEWQCDYRGGRLEQQADQLVLQHPGGEARNLACPLFLDLGSRRTHRPRTWRQLTVAERLKIQPPDVAAGYRVQCGRQQWLFYRSLMPPANRTVLGQNLISEFFAAEFHTNGKTTSLVEIE